MTAPSVEECIAGLNAVGRRLQAEYDAMAPGGVVRDWRFREIQTVLTAIAHLRSTTTPEWREMERAICDAEWGGTQPWEHKHHRFKARYRDLARAALSPKDGAGE